MYAFWGSRGPWPGHTDASSPVPGVEWAEMEEAGNTSCHPPARGEGHREGVLVLTITQPRIPTAQDVHVPEAPV